MPSFAHLVICSSMINWSKRMKARCACVGGCVFHLSVRKCRRINCGSGAPEKKKKREDNKNSLSTLWQHCQKEYTHWIFSDFLFLCFAQSTLFIIYCICAGFNEYFGLHFLFSSNIISLFPCIPSPPCWSHLTEWQTCWGVTHANAVAFDVRDI